MGAARQPTKGEGMRKAFGVLALLVSCATVAVTVSVATAAPPLGQVCPNFDTGHLSANDQTSYTITAPAGQVIVAVCVKAGSAQQGNGAEITYYDPGVTSVTISHTSGKEISHYSVLYDDKTEPPCEPTKEDPCEEEPPK